MHNTHPFFFVEVLIIFASKQLVEYTLTDQHVKTNIPYGELSNTLTGKHGRVALWIIENIVYKTRWFNRYPDLHCVLYNVYTTAIYRQDRIKETRPENNQGLKFHPHFGFVIIIVTNITAFENEITSA